MAREVSGAQCSARPSSRLLCPKGVRPLRSWDNTYVDHGKLSFFRLSCYDIYSLYYQNATIWTGGADGMEEVTGDILLDGGIVKRVGAIQPAFLAQYSTLARVDAKGKWVSPG